MKTNIVKMIILSICLFFAMAVKSQINPADFKVSAEKEKQYQPYVAANLGIHQDFESWKNNNKILYRKEVWYYAESFYVKKNYFAEGSVSIDGGLNTNSIDASQIDISRFESNRKQTEESIVILPGFKDVIVLIPGNKLLYKH